MQEFHYDYIKNEYGNNSRLLFTDIDSLMHEIRTKDFYIDFSKDKEIFDSNLVIIQLNQNVVIIQINYHISSNKRRASNKRRLLISATLLGIHIEISASL